MALFRGALALCAAVLAAAPFGGYRHPKMSLPIPFVEFAPNIADWEEIAIVRRSKINMASVDKLRVNGDLRVHRYTASINGNTYGYLISEPDGEVKDTILLIHGYPDLAMGWRYQIPMLWALGFRIICPDCLGYGASDAPDDRASYALRNVVKDLHDLVKHVGVKTVVVGGHDWGAMIAYRVAAWYPKLVTRLFTFCVPSHLNKQWIDLEAHVNPTPNFAYMQQCVSGAIEEKTQDREGITQYLNALYGGYLPTGERGMSLKGAKFEIASQLLRSPLISEEELDFYVDQYSRNGLRGPLSYYHNMQQNVLDEQTFLNTSGGQMALIKCPTLYVFAVNDGIITRGMAEQMKDSVANLTFKEVAASHWVLWEKPAEANAILKDWLLAQND